MKKKSILLIGDVDYWAFAQIIRWIHAHLSDKYDIYFDYMQFNGWDRSKDWAIDKISFTDIFLHPVKAIKRALLWYRSLGYASRRIKPGIKPKYDIVVFLDYYMDRKANFNFTSKHIIRGIYTDAFPPLGLMYDRKIGKKVSQLSPNEFIAEYYSDADALLLGSPFMLPFYKQHFPNVFFANIVYDTEVFAPYPPPQNLKYEFIVGWTGNPNRPWKGFKEIIEPAVKAASEIHPEIILKTRFYGPMETLHKFYHDVDLVCIASSGDAGPSLFVEASLCGIPSVSTNIGLPSFVIEHQKNGLIVDPSIQAFTSAILYLYENRDVYNKMKQSIREDYIAKLGKEAMIKRWTELFEFVLSKTPNK